MSPKPSRALYVTGDSQFVFRDDIVHEDIAANELLVETHYSGINPADIRHSTHLGIHSTVVGYDFSGRVLKSAPTSRFKAGDIIAGYTPSVMTAADVVHNLFKFPLPMDASEFLAPILIWGASSAVGLSAVQLARASGCRNIFATASPGRYELLKSLGATEIFDYSSPNVVAEITSAVAALGRGPITHALDAVGSMGSLSSADLLTQSTEDGTVLASVILREDERFKMPVAMTKDDWQIQPSGAPGPISIPARPADHWNAWKALLWAVDNYGDRFRLPSVKVLDASAEEALGELLNVAGGKHGFGKVVLRHPLR